MDSGTNDIFKRLTCKSHKIQVLYVYVLEAQYSCIIENLVLSKSLVIYETVGPFHLVIYSKLCTAQEVSGYKALSSTPLYIHRFLMSLAFYANSPNSKLYFLTPLHHLHLPTHYTYIHEYKQNFQASGMFLAFFVCVCVCVYFEDIIPPWIYAIVFVKNISPK